MSYNRFVSDAGGCGWVADPCPGIDYYDDELASSCPDGPICVPDLSDIDPDLYEALVAAMSSAENCITTDPGPCTAKQGTTGPLSMR